MRKKIFVRKLISLGIASAGIGAVVLPVAAASPVLAVENVITKEDLDIKKAALDKAQAEYDAALKEQQAARDVVVNAERALEDAQEKYDEVMKKYRTGFAGFLQWVIDTEMDPAKVEDAKKTLKFITYCNNLYSSSYREYGFMNIDSVSSRDVSNITRMYSTLPWLETFADHYESVEGVSVSISFDYIATSMVDMINSYGASVTGSEDYYNWIWFKESEAHQHSVQYTKEGPYDHSHREVFFLGTYSNDPEDGIPYLKETETVPDNFLNSKVLYQENGFYNDPIANNIGEVDYPRYYTPTNIIIGISCGAFATGANFINWQIYDGDRPCIWDENGNFEVQKGTYSLREYIQALKEYYAIVNPEEFIISLNQTKNDLDESQRSFNAADSFLSSKLYRLKDAQRDYEEAVALFEGQAAALSTAVSEETETMYGAVELQGVQEIESGQVVSSEQAGSTYEQEVYSEADDNESSLVGVKAYSQDTSSESYLVNESELTEIKAPDYQLPQTAFTQGVSHKDTENKKSEESVLAEVLSYVFNGGAIAFIIPAGFKRKKAIDRLQDAQPTA